MSSRRHRTTQLDAQDAPRAAQDVTRIAQEERPISVQEAGQRRLSPRLGLNFGKILEGFQDQLDTYSRNYLLVCLAEDSNPFKFRS